MSILSDTLSADNDQPGEVDPDEINDLRSIFEHCAHYLPAQGSITVFVHHNRLHAFEDSQFDGGVQEGRQLFGCHA